MWRKTNPMIGRWPNRLKDGWERCLHFTKRRRFKMRQDAVRIPAKESTKRRLERQRRRGKSDAYVSPTGSGFQYKWSRLARDTVLPDNVITLPRITHSVGHPAAFPVELPAWFIRLFTDEGDTVLDPFCGSGTTCVAALRGRRRFVGIEINAAYHAKAQRRVSEEPS